MSGSQLGRLFGLVTVIVVAACQAVITAQTGRTDWVHIEDPTSVADAFLVIAFAGAIPGWIFGAYLGWLAGHLDHAPATRLVMLGVQTAAAIVSLGTLVHWPALILPACLPALAACVQLERRTRPPQAVPVAVLA